MSEVENQKIIDALLPTLITLDNFDKGNIQNDDKSKESYKITVEDSIVYINQTRNTLKAQGKDVGLFGVDNSFGLKKVIDTLYSTYDDIDLYPYFEDKAANLLYLIIKDHPFVDGNKRIATTLFDFYTIKNGVKVGIYPSFALHIAESKPNEKELTIDLIINQIQKK
jgi:prophage maintenance system killer protein